MSETVEVIGWEYCIQTRWASADFPEWSPWYSLQVVSSLDELVGKIDGYRRDDQERPLEDDYVHEYRIARRPVVDTSWRKWLQR